MWAGHWPGDLDAARLGFWCRWVDRVTGEPLPFFTLDRPGKWQSCAQNDEGAMPDLNRLRPPYALWNAKTRHWEAA